MAVEDVKEAYPRLLSDAVPQVKLLVSEFGRRRFEMLVKLFLNLPPLLSDAAVTPKRDYLLISSDPEHNEAPASAAILTMNIEEHLLGFTQHGAVVAADLGNPDMVQLVMHARAVVVVLSSRTSESLPQLTAIVCSVQPSLKMFTTKKQRQMPPHKE